ncbi:MAG: aminotransferase [Acidimicrobiales bacterium]
MMEEVEVSGRDPGGGPSLRELDKKYALHPFTSLRSHADKGSLMIVEGQGCRLTDASGTTYLDAMAGLWCVNIGYGNMEMADALRAQSSRLSYYHSFSSMANDTSTLLAEQLVSSAPVPMSKVFFGNSGSDANDTQVKLVWYYNNVLGRPQKKKIISRDRGYHGVTVLTAGLTGLDNLHDGFDLPLPMIRHVRAPHRLWEAELGMTDAEFSFELARELEELILAEGPETVAAFIAEPVQAAGGVIVPPAGYFEAIGAVLDRYDVLLIADEVVCGFGRLGHWFGTEAVGMKPDLITVAKGITSAYVPLSACLVSERVWEALADGGERFGVFGHGYTYSAHPLAAAAALKNLEIIARDGLVDQAAKRGEYLQHRLRERFSDHELVADVRGDGLIAAVEFAASRSPLKAFDPALQVGVRVTHASRENGVITRALPAADTIAFSPPFIVSEEEIDEMVDGTRRALDEVAAELLRH